jgi:hypothetical protein
MAECSNIKALVIPSAAAGIVLLTGAAELVADRIFDLDIEMSYVQREVGDDGAGVLCVRVELVEELPGQMSRRIQTALANLIEATPELAGWTLSVSLTEASDDGADDPGSDDLDAEAARLLPSGDEVAASLLRDIQHEQSVYAAADLFRAVPTEELCTEHLDDLSPTERTGALRRASALAGCLIYAADIVIDELIDDIVRLRANRSTTASAIEDTWVLCQLPARFAASYTSSFAQRFLVAVADVTGRLTRGDLPGVSRSSIYGIRA